MVYTIHIPYKIFIGVPDALIKRNAPTTEPRLPRQIRYNMTRNIAVYVVANQKTCWCGLSLLANSGADFHIEDVTWGHK